MKDFNLQGYLRNNRLLNESIGGYRDIKTLREDDSIAADDDASSNVSSKSIAQNLKSIKAILKNYPQAEIDKASIEKDRESMTFTIVFTEEISEEKFSELIKELELKTRFAYFTSDYDDREIYAELLKPGDGIVEAESIAADQGQYNSDELSKFDAYFDQMVIDINEGFGWIDPGYALETWENTYNIPLNTPLGDLVLQKLIDAGLLFEENPEDPSSDQPGNEVTSLADAKRLAQGDMEGDLYEAEGDDFEYDPPSVERDVDPFPSLTGGDDDDIDYAAYGIDPNDPDKRTIAQFMDDMRHLQNMKGPSLIGGIKDWLKRLKSDYKFNKSFKNSPFKMHETDYNSLSDEELENMSGDPIATKVLLSRQKQNNKAAIGKSSHPNINQDTGEPECDGNMSFHPVFGCMEESEGKKKMCEGCSRNKTKGKLKESGNANPKNVTAYIDIDWHKSYEELMNLAKAFNVKAESLPDEDDDEYKAPFEYRISVPLSREQDLFDFLDNMDDETYQTPENDEEKFQGDIDNIRFSQGKPKVKENIKESRKYKAKGKLKEGKIRPSSSEFTWDI